MPIKLVVFDLDGVLIDSRSLHFHTLNTALANHDPRYVISIEEHLAKYDGYPTKYKLALLTQEKNLDPAVYEAIWQAKQKATQQYILDNFTQDERIIHILAELKRRGLLIYCASNSVWSTVKNALFKKGFLPYIDYFISNEEVKNPKPSPDMYFRCFERAKFTPSEVLICEDSPVGKRAAYASGAHVCPIEDVADVTLEKLLLYINKANMDNAVNNQSETAGAKNINIVIPAAGLGSRFAQRGYSFPKPLIDVNGKPMIQVVVDNINIKGRYIFIVQREHCKKYNMHHLLNAIAPNCEIVQVDGLTEGAACSVLLTKHLINDDTPLIIANSDQYLEWDADAFLYAATSEGIDGAISTFQSVHPKFSFAKLDSHGYVDEVAEKVPISDMATTGVYYWRRGSDFVKYTEQMIADDARVNGEFYTCPVYNYAIKNGSRIKSVHCDKFWCLGTPEDLEYFLQQK